MKIKICIAAMMISMSMGASAQENHVDRIKGLVNAGHYQQALLELDKVKDSRGQIELRKLRALSNLELDQYAIAEILYLGINIKDKGVDVSNNLGLVYLRQLKFVEAIQIFQNTIRRFPEDAAAYENLGDAYLFLAQSTYKKGADTVVNMYELQAKYGLVSESLKKDPTTVSQQILIEAETELERVIEEALESAAKLETKEEYVSVHSGAMEKAHGGRVSRMLNLWAKAKSDHASDAYYSYYDSPELAIESLQKPGDGEVRALEPSVQFISNDQANVVFDEWSGPYSKRTRLFKQLNLALVESEWKITGEKVIHVY